MGEFSIRDRLVLLDAAEKRGFQRGAQHMACKQQERDEAFFELLEPVMLLNTLLARIDECAMHASGKTLVLRLNALASDLMATYSKLNLLCARHHFTFQTEGEAIEQAIKLRWDAIKRLEAGNKSAHDELREIAKLDNSGLQVFWQMARKISRGGRNTDPVNDAVYALAVQLRDTQTGGRWKWSKLARLVYGELRRKRQAGTLTDNERKALDHWSKTGTDQERVKHLRNIVTAREGKSAENQFSALLGAYAAVE